MKWLLLVLPCALVSCESLKKTPEISGVTRSSPAVWLNGAEVHSDVESMLGQGAKGTQNLIYSAGTSKFDGPFRWQFVAVGNPDEHLNMTIEGVQIATKKTRREVSLPAGMLGSVPFAYEEQAKAKLSFGRKKDAAETKAPEWRAVYKLPGDLQLYPKVDGKVTLAAKVSIETSEGSSSEWVNFALVPNASKSKSFVFRQTMIEYGGVPIE